MEVLDSEAIKLIGTHLHSSDDASVRNTSYRRNKKTTFRGFQIYSKFFYEVYKEWESEWSVPIGRRNRDRYFKGIKREEE